MQLYFSHVSCIGKALSELIDQERQRKQQEQQDEQEQQPQRHLSPREEPPEPQ